MNEPLSENNVGQRLPRSHLQKALLRVQAESLPPVALGLGVLCAAFALSHMGVLLSDLAPSMALVAELSAIFYFVVYARFRTRALPDGSVHPLSLALYAVPVLNSELHLYLSRDPLQTNIALCIIDAGFFYCRAAKKIRTGRNRYCSLCSGGHGNRQYDLKECQCTIH